MRATLTKQTLALLMAGSQVLTACGGADQIKSPKARGVGFEQDANGEDDEDDIDSITGKGGKGTALNAQGVNRAREVDRIQQQIIQDTALKATSLEAKAKLQVEIANAESKKINGDAGTAVGSGVAAGLLTALAITLGVVTGGVGAIIVPAVAAIGAGGVAIGAGISSANNTAQVNKTVTQLKAELRTVEMAITELDSRIQRQQAMVQNLLKEGAAS